MPSPQSSESHDYARTPHSPTTRSSGRPVGDIGFEVGLGPWRDSTQANPVVARGMRAPTPGADSRGSPLRLRSRRISRVASGSEIVVTRWRPPRPLGYRSTSAAKVRRRSSAQLCALPERRDRPRRRPGAAGNRAARRHRAVATRGRERRGTPTGAAAGGGPRRRAARGRREGGRRRRLARRRGGRRAGLARGRGKRHCARGV